MLNDYKQECEKIEVPSKLKTETLLKMKEVEEKQPRFSLKFAFMIVSAFILSIGVMIGLSMQNTGNNLKDGEIVAKHSFDEGELYFEQEEGNALFGNDLDNVEMKTIGKIEAQSLSNQTFKEFEIEGLSLVKKEYFAYYQKGALLRVEWVYSYEAKGKEIQMHYYNVANEIATNSIIDNKKVAIYYQGTKKEVTFDSYFMHESGMVEVIGYEMSQQEYIDTLVKIVKKLN